MPPRRSSAVAVGVGGVVSLGVALVMLWPALGSGYLLYRDFVTVPDPVLNARVWGWQDGAPRAVPLDAVMASLDPVVPTWLQQKLMLFGCLVMAGTGVAVLVRRHGALTCALAAFAATWSPYAAERLLLGQAPTLLSWASLPWLVVSGRAGTPRRRVGLTVLAALPAALTPYGGLVAVVAAVVVAVLGRRSVREVGALVVVGLLWCAPWLAPALTGRHEAGQEAGAAAFRLGLDGPWSLVDVLTGGGVWSSAAALPSRAGPGTLLAASALVGLAVVGLRRVRRRGLAVSLLVVPPLVAVALASGPGLTLWEAAQRVPGVALLRDTHRWLSASALALAVLAAVGAGACGSLLSARVTGWSRAVVRGTVGATAVGLVMLSAPDAPGALRAAHRPVEFPTEWHEVVRSVGDSRVLVLPWQPNRRVAWNGDRDFLDPLPRALPGGVMSSQVLQVRRGDAVYRIGPFHADGEAWARGEVDPAVLRRLGVEVVVEWVRSPGPWAPGLRGLQLVHEGEDFRVWRVRPATGSGDT